MKIYFETIVQANLEAVVAGFDEELFTALKPWWIPAKLKQFGMDVSDKVILEFPMRQQWISEITSVDLKEDKYFQFIDEGIELPFPLKTWKHIHRLEKIDSNQTKIIDNIEYNGLFGILTFLMYPLLWYSFKIRETIYCERLNAKS